MNRLDARRRRRAARDRARAGTPDAARELAEVLATDPDEAVREIARRALSELDDPVAVEEACDVLIDTGDEGLAAVLSTAGRWPTDPGRRALLLFLAGDRRYADLDADSTLLRATLAAAGPVLREKVAASARAQGRLEWVGALSVRDRDGEQLSPVEWENLVAVLTAGQRWERLWRWVPVAPPVHGARIMRELDRAGWQPRSEPDRRVLALARACAAEPPSGIAYGDGPILTLGGDGRLEMVASPDGRLLATFGSGDLTGTQQGDALRLWSLPGGEPVTSFPTDRGSVQALAFSPDCRLLATGYLDGTIQLWELPSGEPLHSFAGPGNRVDALLITPDGGLLAATGGHDPRGGRWRMGLWRLPGARRVQLVRERYGGALTLACTPDGTLLIGVGNAGDAHLWELPSGRHRPFYRTTKGPPLWTSPDGRLMVYMGYRATAKLCRLSTGETVTEIGPVDEGSHGFGPHAGPTVVTPDGALLLSAGSTGIRRWRLPSGQEIEPITGDNRYLGSLALTPDGRVLAGSSIAAGCGLGARTRAPGSATFTPAQETWTSVVSSCSPPVASSSDSRPSGPSRGGLPGASGRCRHGSITTEFICGRPCCAGSLAPRSARSPRNRPSGSASHRTSCSPPTSGRGPSSSSSWSAGAAGTTSSWTAFRPPSRRARGTSSSTAPVTSRGSVRPGMRDGVDRSSLPWVHGHHR